MKILAPDTRSIPIYRECNKTTHFSILGFFRLEVKLGFEFFGVLPNQKFQPFSINFDFDEEINPIPFSLKNSSSVRRPNFPHQN